MSNIWIQTLNSNNMFSLNTHHAFLNTYVLITSKSDEQIEIIDELTGKKYVLEPHNCINERFSVGKHFLSCNEYSEEIIIEDAIKLGGGNIKKAFVFDDSDWVFVETDDRLYMYNRETCEERVEYNLVPEEIMSVGRTYQKTSPYHIFRTENDYLVYNAECNQFVISFNNLIFHNSHIVIYKDSISQKIIVFNYIKKVIVEEFDGQYSFNGKLFYIKDNALYSMNLNTSYKICLVFDVGNNYCLAKNYLLKQSGNGEYKLYDLGYGERIVKEYCFSSKFCFSEFLGVEVPSYTQLKDTLDSFHKENLELLEKYPGINHNIISYKWKSLKRENIKGETSEFAILELIIRQAAFAKTDLIKTVKMNLADGTISDVDFITTIDKDTSISTKFEAEYNGRLLGYSASHNLFITQTNEGIYEHNQRKHSEKQVLKNTLDTSKYENAYFSSDSKKVILLESEDIMGVLGFEDLVYDSFDIEGTKVFKESGAGINGYSPELCLNSELCRKPVWRDPITLKNVDSISHSVFKSPDGRYSAKNNYISEYENIITGEVYDLKSYIKLCADYRFPNRDITSDTDQKQEIEKIIKKRKELISFYNKEKVIEAFRKCSKFRHVESKFNKDSYKNNYTEEQLESMILKAYESYIDICVSDDRDFYENLVVRNDYIIYLDHITDVETKVLIGHDIWFLNYISYSFNSTMMAFAAKRSNAGGVLGLYNLMEKKIVHYAEIMNDGKISRYLKAVWTSVFSRDNHVAFYDSTANTYLLDLNDKTNMQVAVGKSFLCFSPSGHFVALSNQKYLSYQYHPVGWGHQPSSNVYVCPASDIQQQIAHYTDLGIGVKNLCKGGGNVASVAFSTDESRLLMVGSDGVVVVRNLHIPKDNETYQNVIEEVEYGSHYGEFAGTYAQDVMGYDDDTINDAFEGDPDAYWNID